MSYWRNVYFLLLAVGFLQGAPSVRAQEIDFSNVALGNYTYRSKTFEKGLKIAQVTGSISLANVGGTLVYTSIDRNSAIEAYVSPGGQYKVKVFNKRTDKFDVRKGMWRYQNPFSIVAHAKNLRGHASYKDRLGLPLTGFSGVILTINLRKDVHQKIFARRN